MSGAIFASPQTRWKSSWRPASSSRSCCVGARDGSWRDGSSPVRSVRQLPSRQWQARYRSVDGVLHAAPTTFGRRSDADRWLAAVEADMSRGRWVDPSAGKLTVKEWSDRWLAAASGHLKVKTSAGYEYLLKTKIDPRFGHLPLDAVKPIM